MVICGVESQQLVRDLGKHLYETIVIHGRATWLRYNQELRHLRITSIGSHQHKPGSIMSTLQRVREAGGHAWDKVKDPDAFIRELRRA
jgi:hypothetical protein